MNWKSSRKSSVPCVENSCKRETADMVCSGDAAAFRSAGIRRIADNKQCQNQKCPNRLLADRLGHFDQRFTFVPDSQFQARQGHPAEFFWLRQSVSDGHSVYRFPVR